jgi:hypothetical protein
MWLANSASVCLNLRLPASGLTCLAPFFGAHVNRFLALHSVSGEDAGGARNEQEPEYVADAEPRAGFVEGLA